MIAKMIKDNYIDLVPNYPYEVTKVFRDGRIKVKGSPGIYDGRNFLIMQDRKEISLEEAYKQYRKVAVRKRICLFRRQQS